MRRVPPLHRAPKAVVSKDGVEKALVDAAVLGGRSWVGGPPKCTEYKTLFGLISGFHRGVEEICVVLQFYAA